MILVGGLALEGHHREPDDIRLEFVHEPLDGRPDTLLDQNKIGHGDPMMGIDVPGEGGERTVRHANANGGMCSNESGIERSRMFMSDPLYAEPLLPA